MGQHDALGEAGCSRRINQRGDTLRGVDGNRFRFDCLVKRANGDGAQPSRVLDNRAMPLGVLSGLRRDAGGVDNSAGAAMFADLIDFPNGKTCVYQHRPGVESGQR